MDQHQNETEKQQKKRRSGVPPPGKVSEKGKQAK